MRRASRNGFTLVEMLVVIAIIGVLAAVLLSALRTLKEHGQKAKCKSNIRNLALGVINKATVDTYTLYASSFVWEHWQVWYDQRGWVSWLNSSGNSPGWSDTTPPNIFRQPTCYIHRTNKQLDGRRAIEQGSLWEYVNKDMKIYLCPKHNTTKIDTFAVCRSYAMNGYFFYSANDRGTEGDNTVTRGNRQTGFGWTNWEPRKLYDVPEPMRMMLFAEIRIPNDSPNNGDKHGRWDDGVLDAWGDHTDHPKNGRSPPLHANPHESIGFNHRSQGKNWGHVVFLDGHVREVPERHKDPDTNNDVNPTMRAALGKF